MEVVILVLMVIGILFAIASGVWVAIALVSAITAHQRPPGVQLPADEKDISQDI